MCQKEGVNKKTQKTKSTARPRIRPPIFVFENIFVHQIL